MREELRLRILTDAGEKFFGEGPYRLLRCVERQGSLRAAAGELGMAYSKANRIMGRAERLLGAPLTRRRIGGPDGGGSALTPLAQELLARYETFRADCEAAAKASFARNFGDLSMAEETANGFPPTSPNHPSSDSSLAAKTRERRIDKVERVVAAQGAATEGDHSARSSGDSIEEGRASGDTRRSPEVSPNCPSGDSPFAVKAREQHIGGSECTVAAQEAVTVEEHSARSSSDSSKGGRAAGDTEHSPERSPDYPSGNLPFAAGAKERHTDESECAIVKRGVTAEEEHTDKFALAAREIITMESSRFPGEASSAAPNCSRPASEDCERQVGKSILAAQEAAAREPSRFPGEASPAAPGYSRSAAKDCKRYASKSILAAQEAAARESSRFPSEASAAALNCSRSASEDCERQVDKSILTAQEAAAREPFRFPGEVSPAASGCLRTASEDCKQHALTAREAAARGASRFPGEASPAAPNCSQIASEDCERNAGEPALAAAMRPAAGESYRHSGEIPAALGCVVLAAGRARRFGGGKLLAELRGRPVLARTLEALPRGSFCRIAVVTSDPAVLALCREMGFPVREYPGGALSDSIREGLAEMDGTDGCMFVNGDQPLLRTDSLRRLASAFADDPARVYRLAHGGIAASPVVFPASAYPALRALTGESGGMAALRGGDWEVRCVEAEEEFELWDVDDSAALKRAEARLGEDSRR